jgi:hypothetical protein
VNTTTETNWFGRNWKWALPTGCLTLLLLVGGFVAAIIFFVFSLMKSNEAYQHALSIASHDPEVVAALGQPIQDGWLVTGSTNENGAGGEAQLAIPLSGPRGAGTLYVEARKSAGQWRYVTMAVEVDANKQRIDLLDAPTEPAR